ncbi:MAG TPA: hypothetical protein VJN70_07105 [Gemmatimonadaceae bacterium]|nr:hypothetical protein [Gemmatimonadaceae bacterium]
MTRSEMNKLTPLLTVESIEPCLPFWVERLGFAKTVEVPDGNSLGFVILAKDGVEIMYQSRASVEKDIPPMGRGTSTGLPAMGLFIEVGNIDEVERSLVGIEHVIPRRRTFYGMDEVVVREPGGYVIVFAQPVAANA